MRWSGDRESSNVEDRRGLSPGTVIMGGGLGTIVIALLVFLLGGNPTEVLQPSQDTRPGVQQPVQSSPQEEQLKKFVSVVLADTEDVWHEIFREQGLRYREPKLVIYRGRVESACGLGSAAAGPFYCPGDETVYIDLSFYDELKRQFGAPGDFAQAYVIAHEVGHHVQKLLGTMDKVDSYRGRVSEEESNQLSVRLELQADFYAGVWANRAQKMKNILEPGDVEEALRAASAVGDDNIQKQTQGYVVPDSFTHGTAEQRMRWFRKGFDTGDIRQGNTFNTPNP